MLPFQPFDLADDAVETLATASRLIQASIANPVLDIIGDRWVLKILQELHFAPGRFDQLKSSLRISRGTLATRLDDLIDHGLIQRTQYRIAPPRFEYWLTEKGSDTAPILHSIRLWDRTWAAATADNRQQIHGLCGQVFQPILACGSCKSTFRARDITYSAGPGPKVKASSLSRRPRRRSTPDSTALSLSAADTLGDRWTALVMSCAWFGLRRFSEMQRAIDIAPNILTRRLSYLSHHGILARHLYQQRPARAEYILTEKGFDLYPMTVALLRWGDHWIAGDTGAPIILSHKSCGAALEATLYCGACSEQAHPSDLSLKGDLPDA